MSSISFLRSASSSALFLAALDFAVDFDAFDAAFLGDVEDFFPDRAVSFEDFFIAMRRTVPQLRVDCEILSHYSASTIVATRCCNAADGSEQRPVWTGDV